MIEKFTKCIYDMSVLGAIKSYENLFNDMVDDDKTIDYWKKALKFYQSLSEEKKDEFFEILKIVMTDTISEIFGVIDGSTTLEGYELSNYELFIDNKNTAGELQETFLEYVENIDND